MIIKRMVSGGSAVLVLVTILSALASAGGASFPSRISCETRGDLGNDVGGGVVAIMAEEKQEQAKSSCQAHVVKTTSASGAVTLKLICDGQCANGNPCEERWLPTYDWKNHKRILTRTCYCDGELRETPCCTAEDANAGAYIRDKCRIALVYPPEAQIGPDGQQSRVPTKDPIDVFCINDCPRETTVCDRSERSIEQDNVKVELITCKCFH